MTIRTLSILICVLTLFSIRSFAQTPARRQTSSPPPAEEQSADINSNGTVANELSLLRKSLQTLNARLREISEKISAPDSKGGASTDPQNRISLGLDLLTRAEQRAEILRKQLIELTEKESTYRSRLVQLDDDMRPDSLERSISLNGSTRTPEIRETRRRVLENERRGFESLLNQTGQARARLEDDVKQADALVSRLRQRVLPLIEREIDKINPNQQ